MKLAFFDVDGTLSAPCYVVDGERKIGLPFDCWEDYCDIHKERTYDDCAVNKPVERYARYLK
ncbi:MAG: hypothetical protein J6P61_03685, partial [Erysipelotrichaceae bacterium]|nr:hypothetical protein [Erysipelotrichaceae bacterium]